MITLWGILFVGVPLFLALFKEASCTLKPNFLAAEEALQVLYNTGESPLYNTRNIDMNSGEGLFGSTNEVSELQSSQYPKSQSCASPFCAYPGVLYRLNNTLSKDRFSPCTESDIGSFFTVCENQKKYIVQYYRPPAMCDSASGVSIKSPVEVDCNFSSCEPGKFFQLSSKTCEKCPKGQFNPGNKIFFANATSWPAESFIREHNVRDSIRVGTDEQADDVVSRTNSIISLIHNDVIDVKSYSVSELAFRVFVSNPPVKLRFDYRVYGGENERNLDGSIYRWIERNTGEIIIREMLPNDRTKMLFHEYSYENSNVWKEKTVDFTTRAVYEILFRFNRQFSRTDSMNGMQIKDLRIEGMAEKVTSCLKCPPGTYASEEGGVSCKRCPKNTFASSEGSTNCEPCPPGQTSFEGSAECHVGSIPCTPQDYYEIEYENTCFDETNVWNINGKRKYRFEWIQPKICQENATGSVTLPPNEERHCPTEPPKCTRKGEILEKSREDLHCGFCMDKMVPNSDHTTCQPCNENSFPVNRTLIISDFIKQIDHLQNFTTSCIPESQCQSNGFRRTPRYMDSGVGNGRAISKFSFDVDSTHHYSGTVVMHYTMKCAPGKARASIFVDDALHHIAECTGCESETTSTLSISVRPAFSSNIRVEYNSLESQYSNNCGFMRINAIELNGLGLGGFSACQACDAGLELQEVEGEKVCVKCNPGYYSVAGEKCVKCPKNTYASEYGTKECAKCPGIMTSEEGSSHCIFPSPPTEVLTNDNNQNYNWTSVVRNNINSKKIPVVKNNDEPQKMLHIEIPLPGTPPQKAKCPPHILACVELEINGNKEIFSLADVAEVMNPPTPRSRHNVISRDRNAHDDGLNVSGAPEDLELYLNEEISEEVHNADEQKTMLRLYKENNRLCNGEKSTVDINFICSNLEIPAITARQTGNCTFEVDVESLESCRMCRLDEYTLVKRTECIGNRLEKHWVVKEGAPLCNYRSAPPESTWEYCVKENLLYLAWLIPSIALVVICCITMCCCAGTIGLWSKVRKLKDENERLSLLHNEGVELRERRDVAMDVSDP